jgi:hypothetical protein
MANKRGSAMCKHLDAIFESDAYAEWVQNNAIHYGITVCNGDTLIAAMENDDLALAYLDFIQYDGDIE